jgi:hypothetical protein
VKKTLFQKKTSFWMTVSGFCAFSFFLIANFTAVFFELKVTAGCIQMVLNVFVFISWLRGYRASSGFKKFLVFLGVGGPVLTFSITFFRVLIPFLFHN